MFVAVGLHWRWIRNKPNEESTSTYTSLSNRPYGLVYIVEVKLGFKNRVFTSALLPMPLILVPQVVTTKPLWETALRALPSSVPELRPREQICSALDPLPHLGFQQAEPLLWLLSVRTIKNELGVGNKELKNCPVPPAW